MGNTLLPRHDLDSADVGKCQYVGQASFEPTFDVDYIAHRRSAVDRATEGHPVTHRTSEPVDQDVAPALGADQVRITNPDHVDALPDQFGREVLYTRRIEMRHPETPRAPD